MEMPTNNNVDDVANDDSSISRLNDVSTTQESILDVIMILLSHLQKIMMWKNVK